MKIQNLVSGALATPYEQLRDELSKQPQLFIDESPTKQKHSKAWLWVAVAPLFAVFGVFLNRKRESLKALESKKFVHEILHFTVANPTERIVDLIRCDPLQVRTVNGYGSTWAVNWIVRIEENSLRTQHRETQEQRLGVAA